MSQQPLDPETAEAIRFLDNYEPATWITILAYGKDWLFRFAVTPPEGYTHEEWQQRKRHVQRVNAELERHIEAHLKPWTLPV